MSERRGAHRTRAVIWRRAEVLIPTPRGCPLFSRQGRTPVQFTLRMPNGTWHARQDSNLRHSVLETDALPSELRSRRANDASRCYRDMFSSSLSVWSGWVDLNHRLLGSEPSALARLRYTQLVEEEGFEPSKPKHRIYSPAPLPSRALLRLMCTIRVRTPWFLWDWLDFPLASHRHKPLGHHF